MSTHCFPFSSLQGKFFFSPRTMAFFHCYHRRWSSFPWNLLVSSSPTSVTTRSDRCYHWQFNPKPSYFHNPAGGRDGSGPWGGLPEQECKTDRHSSSVARPQGAAREEEGSTNAPIYICPPPPPRSGDAKQILPLTGDAVALACASMPERSPMRGRWGGGLSPERVRCNTGTVTPHGKWQSILHAEHPWRVPPPKIAPRSSRKGTKEKKQLTAIDPKMVERKRKILQKKSSPRNGVRE